MAHISTQVWATMDTETRPYKGFPASLITEDFMRAKDADYAGGYLLQSYGILPLAWAEQVVRGRDPGRAAAGRLPWQSTTMLQASA